MIKKRGSCAGCNQATPETTQCIIDFTSCTPYVKALLTKLLLCDRPYRGGKPDNPFLGAVL